MFKDQIDFWFNEVEKVMSGVIGYDARGVREWKDIWMSQKGDLLPFFDENGHFEKDVKIDDFSEIEKGVMVRNVADSISGIIVNTIQKRMGNTHLSYGVLDNLRDDVFSLEPSEIMENKIVSDRGVHKKGTKTSKYLASLRKFELEAKGTSPDYVEKYVENYNIAYSMLRNTLKNVGRIGLSINPMDFILVSAHTNGWKSCHNIDNGCYRMGGISYMLDNTSLVGYAYEKKSPLRNSGYYSDEEFPLKLWRAMTFIAPNGRNHGIISRQYPSEKIIYSFSIRELLAELMGNINGVAPNYMARAYNNISLKDTESYDTEHEAIVRRGSNYNYVDGITSHVVLNSVSDTLPARLYISIGSSKIPCTECGTMRNCEKKESGSEYLTCDDCDDRGLHCNNCGEHCGDDYYFEGEYYCESCYDEFISCCEYCDSVTYRDELYEVINSRGYESYVCSYCRDKYYNYCGNCESYYENTTEVDVDGHPETWCDDCIDDKAHTCQECGGIFTVVVEIDGKSYCDSCAYENFSICEACGEYSSEITSVGDKDYCKDCLKKHCVECEECGEYTDKPCSNLCESCLVDKEKAVV